MKDRFQVVVGAVVGAIVGGAAGYFFFTDRGREMRDQIDPAIAHARRELMRVQGTIATAAQLATDGLRMVHNFSKKGAQPDAPRAVSH